MAENNHHDEPAIARSAAANPSRMAQDNACGTGWRRRPKRAPLHDAGWECGKNTPPCAQNDSPRSVIARSVATWRSKAASAFFCNPTPRPLPKPTPPRIATAACLVLACATLTTAPAQAAPTWQKVTMSSGGDSANTYSNTDGTSKFTVPSTLQVLGISTAANGDCTPLPMANVGTATLNGLSAAATGGAVTSFQVCTYATNPCGTSLAAGASCNFGVRLTVVAPLGTSTETLSVGASGLPFASVSVVGNNAFCNWSTIGSVCSDGTIYAGLSPDGNVPMYTTPCDLGQTGTQKNCTGTRSTYKWGTNNKTTGYTSTITGEANTDGLVANYGSYNDGSTVGVPVAQACADLSYGGNSDWYLLALNELDVLYTNKDAIGGLNTGGGGYYLSSSEYSNVNAWIKDFSSSSNSGYSKVIPIFVRCVRR